MTTDSLDDISVIVRECGERTADACVARLAELLGQPVFRVSARPFHAALRQSLELGLQLGRAWTLCIDADVLVTPGLRDFLADARRLPENIFEAQALVLDKLIPVFRPAGNHLYRTAMLQAAIPLIRSEGSLRPESDMILAMAERGRRAHQSMVVVGLHDFEQTYEDIYKKAYLHCHKHDYHLPSLEPIWQSLATTDADFRVALAAIQSARDDCNLPEICRNFRDDEAKSAILKLGLDSKPPLINANDAQVLQLLRWRTEFSGEDRALAGDIQAKIDIGIFGRIVFLPGTDGSFPTLIENHSKAIVSTTSLHRSTVIDPHRSMNDQQRPKRCIFVLTSSGNDVYSAMTRIAIASLRLSNPGLPITVVVDKISDEAIRHTSDPLPMEVDEWLAFPAPESKPELRNRFLKTKLRSLIDGPYLFLDSDIFVRGSLDEVFSLDCDLAGARNHSREIFSEQIWDRDRATLDAMGWNIDSEVYLNGGVLYFNDTPAARQFAAEWHRRWLESSAGRDSCRDQPALNSALAACRPRLTVLPDGFNAQIVPSPETAVDALVWHFYSSVTRPASTGFDELVGNLLAGGELLPDDIRQYTLSRHPWNDAGMIEAGLQLAALRRESTQLKRALEGTQRELRKVLASRSWRLTRPLRTIDALLKKY